MYGITKKETKLYSGFFRVLTAVITLVFAVSAYTTVFAASTAVISVKLIDDGKESTVSSLSSDPEEILKQEGISLGANDELDITGFSAENGGTIIINRAKTLRVIDENGVAYVVAYSTLGNTLDERSFELNDSDETSVSLDTPVFDGMEVEITRAHKVTVEVNGSKTEVMTVNETAEELLEKAGVDVDKDDHIKVAKSSSSSQSKNEEKTIVVEVEKVDYKERTELEEIPFESITKKTDSLFSGESKVVQEGKKGVREIVYTDKFVDGKLVSTEKTSDKVTVEPLDKIVNVGTKTRPDLINFRKGISAISDLAVPSKVKLENGVPVNYVDCIIGESTAYTGDPCTSTGRKPMQGHVAVDPREIPYGSELYIVSLDGNYIYGYAIAADTGGFIYNSDTVVDLYLDTESMCDQWGRRDVAIYVISYGNGR